MVRCDDPACNAKENFALWPMSTTQEPLWPCGETSGSTKTQTPTQRRWRTNAVPRWNLRSTSEPERFDSMLPIASRERQRCDHSDGPRIHRTFPPSLTLQRFRGKDLSSETKKDPRQKNPLVPLIRRQGHIEIAHVVPPAFSQTDQLSVNRATTARCAAGGFPLHE